MDLERHIGGCNGGDFREVNIYLRQYLSLQNIFSFVTQFMQSNAFRHTIVTKLFAGGSPWGSWPGGCHYLAPSWLLSYYGLWSHIDISMMLLVLVLVLMLVSISWLDYYLAPPKTWFWIQYLNISQCDELTCIQTRSIVATWLLWALPDVSLNNLHLL